jgi:hypothetical protein
LIRIVDCAETKKIERYIAFLEYPAIQEIPFIDAPKIIYMEITL